MPNQFNATIAGQTYNFRGTSTVDVKANTVNFPNTRAIAAARYALRVNGGVSGTFCVQVIGRIGDIAGSTFLIAGISGVAAAGTYLLTPYTYGAAGTPGILGDTATPVISTVQTIQDVVPPSHVAFFPTTAATAGISAACTVAANLWVG